MVVALSADGRVLSHALSASEADPVQWGRWEISLPPDMEAARQLVAFLPSNPALHGSVSLPAGEVTEREIRIDVYLADAPPPDAGRWMQAVVGTDTAALPPPPPAPGDRLQDCAVCPELVVVPPGTFVMGSPPDETGRDEDEPQRTIHVERAFAVGRFEVTFAEWDACVEGGGCRGHRADDAGWGRDWRPVIDVSWHDAQVYLQWLSAATGHTYRMLTEAEWEYAARGGSTTAYVYGARLGPVSANHFATGGHQTAPVGSFAPNGFGLYDVEGNVWEWVSDCWTPPAGRGAGPTGPCNVHVRRGGSWANDAAQLRLANRNNGRATLRAHNLGFRVARDIGA